MRRDRVVDCLASSTQQMNSLRAKGVMSIQAASAAAFAIKTSRRSVGSLCTTPPGTRLLLTEHNGRKESAVRQPMRSRLGAKIVLRTFAVASAAILPGCRSRVPDEAWARRVFAENEVALDLLATKVEEAVGELPPLKPSASDDFPTRGKFYDDLYARCETLKTKVVGEIKKKGNIVEWQVPIHVTNDPPTATVPCAVPYRYSPRDDRFDVPPEKGFTVGRWQIGRRVAEVDGKKQPAIEVLSGAIVGGLTLEIRWLLVEARKK